MGKNKWIDPLFQANSYHTSVPGWDLYKKVSPLTNKLVLSQVLDYAVIIPARRFTLHSSQLQHQGVLTSTQKLQEYFVA